MFKDKHQKKNQRDSQEKKLLVSAGWGHSLDIEEVQKPKLKKQHQNHQKGASDVLKNRFSDHTASGQELWWKRVVSSVFVTTDSSMHAMRLTEQRKETGALSSMETNVLRLCVENVRKFSLKSKVKIKDTDIRWQDRVPMLPLETV